MITLVLAAQVAFALQVIHSIEELATGFHKRWYLFKMPFVVFLAFELCFTGFWYAVIFTEYFPNKTGWLLAYVLLMMANGIQHIVWFLCVKQYVPGLVTSVPHLIWSLIALFSL